jgi:hypothetical protein
MSHCPFPSSNAGRSARGPSARPRPDREVWQHGPGPAAPKGSPGAPIGRPGRVTRRPRRAARAPPMTRGGACDAAVPHPGHVPMRGLRAHHHVRPHRTTSRCEHRLAGPTRTRAAWPTRTRAAWPTRTRAAWPTRTRGRQADSDEGPAGPPRRLRAGTWNPAGGPTRRP